MSEPSIREMAEAWLADPGRPQVAPEANRRWELLIDEWIADGRTPLLIRKPGWGRGSIIRHPSGRELVPTDNSPATWALTCAVDGIVPDVGVVHRGLQLGTIPVAFALSRKEQETAVYKGLLHRMRPGRDLNKRGWKVCHIDSVAGTGGRARPEDRPISDLEAEMRRFLAPSNMFVVHLKAGQATYGLGEQHDFIRAFRRASTSDSSPVSE